MSAFKHSHAKIKSAHLLSVIQSFAEFMPDALIRCIRDNKTMEYLLSQLDKGSLVSMLIFNFIFLYQDSKKKTNFHKHLASIKYLSSIAHKIHIYSAKDGHEEALCECSFDLFKRIFTGLRVDKSGSHLLVSLITDNQMPELMKNLIVVIANIDSSYTSRRCSADLITILFCIENSYTTKRKPPKNTEKALARLKTIALKSAEFYTEPIFDFIIAESARKTNTGSPSITSGPIKLNAFTVSTPFSALRLTVLKILEAIVLNQPPEDSSPSANQNSTETLHFPSLPSFLSSWKSEKVINVCGILTQWFFEYRFVCFPFLTFIFCPFLLKKQSIRFNNLYHSIFCTIVCHLIFANHIQGVFVFFKNHNLLDRLIDFYLDDTIKAENKGHILLILEQCSLSSNPELCAFRDTNDRWKRFKATLEEIVNRMTINNQNSPSNNSDEDTDSDDEVEAPPSSNNNYKKKSQEENIEVL